MKLSKLSEPDQVAVASFQNFLSWGEVPDRPSTPDVMRRYKRNVPPAWWAHALGATKWCPPKGEL